MKDSAQHLVATEGIGTCWKALWTSGLSTERTAKGLQETASRRMLPATPTSFSANSASLLHAASSSHILPPAHVSSMA